MQELFKTVFWLHQYMPHGHSYLWQTPLVGLHLISDLMIALAYFSISALLLFYTHKRKSHISSRITRLFSAFILICGIGHLISIGTLWYPVYGLSGGIQAVTAIVSVYTAIELITLLPIFLALKTPEELSTINQSLQTEIAERKEAETNLHSLVACTAATTGPELFPALVASLAIALEVDQVFIAQVINPGEPHLKTVANWSQNQLIGNIIYDSRQTPCETILEQQCLYHCPNNLQQKFPKAIELGQPELDSYLGVPLINNQGDTIGILGVQHHQEIANLANAKSFLKVFAARVTAELQRQKAEQSLQQAHDTLEVRIQERTAELMKAKEAAEVANRAKSTFLAKISHELRTPLNAILGFAQIMSQDTDLTAEHQEHLKIIDRSGAHLLGLINNLLEMAKFDAGQLVLQETQFDLLNLLSGLEEILQKKADPKGIVLKFRNQNLPRYIRADQDKLRQILTHVLDNAIKFTEQGSVVLTAKLDDTQTTPYLVIKITDTGKGITPKEQQHIFLPFSQIGNYTQEQGAGLGLAISKECLKAMHGNITLVSEANRGTTVTLQFPINVITQAVTPININQKILRLTTDQPSYRILIAEDAPTNRLLLKKILTTVGFQIKETVNGQQAIQAWDSWQPDLILMDMQMPVMDGYQATQEIKLRAGKTAPPIIALTASTFINQQKAMVQAGCDACIHKPFNREHLLAVIGNFLQATYHYEQSHIPSSLSATTLANASSPLSIAKLPSVV